MMISIRDIGREAHAPHAMRWLLLCDGHAPNPALAACLTGAQVLADCREDRSTLLTNQAAQVHAADGSVFSVGATVLTAGCSGSERRPQRSGGRGHLR